MPIVSIDLDGQEELHYLESMEDLLVGMNKIFQATDKMTKRYADIQKNELSNIKIYFQYEKIKDENWNTLGVTSDETSEIQWAVSIKKYLADPRTSEAELSKDVLVSYNDILLLSEKLGINLDNVKAGDQFYLITINKAYIYNMEVGSDPKGRSSNPVTWQRELSKAVKTFFHEVVAHVTEKIVDGEKGADHEKYFGFKKYIDFYGKKNVDFFMKTNSSPSTPAPSSEAGKTETDVNEAIKKLEEKK